LHKYVDHKLMFEKAFMNPVNPILTAINWQPEPTISLEDFFA